MVPPVTKATSPQLLYVDGLNYMKIFLGLEVNFNTVDVSNLVFEDCLRMLEKTTQQFMQEAKQAGWKVSVFLDNCKLDPAEVVKYWERGQRSMEEGGSTCIPPSTTLLLGNAFKKAGAQVFYSWGCDNDPTMAAYAHLDDAAVLSRDGDFMRYFGKKASGETYFLQKLFSGFSMGDARNGGSLALWRKRIPSERYGRKDWVLETGIGEVKGGRVPFLAHRPAVSADYLLLTEREEGVPHRRVQNCSCYPFAFPTDSAFDPVVLMRPLRLAAYQLLGETSVQETMLRWVPDRDGMVVERQSHLWRHSHTGWQRTEVRNGGGEAEDEAPVADSWEDLDEEAEDEGQLSSAEAALVEKLVGELGQAPPSSMPKLLRAVQRVYAMVFGEGDASIPTAAAHPGTGEAIGATARDRRNEHTCRLLAAAHYMAAGWPAVHHSMADLVLAFHAARDGAAAGTRRPT